MKPNILNRFLIKQLLAAVCVTSSAYAATAIKSGGLATELNGTATGVWTGGSGANGSPTSADDATWNPASLGAGLTVGSAVNWGSISISGALTNIGITGSQITTGNITLAGAQALTIANDMELSGNSIYSIADVTASSAADVTLSGIISGTGFGITKSGGGTLILSGSSSYTGATLVNAGTLSIASTGALTSDVSVGAGATLAGGGITSGDITFAAGSNIIAAGTLPVQGVNVTANATTNIFVTGTPTGSPTVVKVIEHTGTLTGLANFTPATNYRDGLIADTGTVALTYTGENKFWNDAAGTWEVGTASEWDGDTKFYWGDSVTFDSIITADRTVTLNGKLAPISVTVSNTANTYTFSGSGEITGPCSLTKSGAGTLTLSTTNSYTGPTTVSAGQLNVTGAGTLGATTGLAMSGGILDLGATSQTVMGPVNVSAPCTIQNGSLTGLSYAASNATATTATISANLLANGAAGLTKSGAGTLELSGANTYTGTTTLSAGILSLTGGNNRLSNTGTLKFTAASKLDVGSTEQSLDNLTIVNSSTSALTGTVTGSGKLTLTGPTLNVGSTVTSATLTLGMGGATPLSSFAYDNPAGTVNITTLVNNGTTASAVVNCATTNVITASEINLARFSAPSTTNNKGSNINMGQTNTLNADTITIGAGDRVAGSLQYQSASSLTSPSLTIRGTDGTSRANMLLGSSTGTTGSTALAGTVNLVSFITGTSTVDARLGTLTIGQNARASTVNAATSNCNGTFRMGAGTVDATTILLGQDTDGFDSTNASNSVTNATFTTDTAATGFGLVKVNTLTMGDKRGTSTKMTLNSIFNLNNGGVLQAGSIADGSNAATTVTRTINWNDGTIKNYDSATDLSISSTATGAAAITLKLADTGSHTFDIDASRSATVSAVLADATTLGTLEKSGAGTLTLLNGASTYSGGTTVNTGTLLANNTTGSASGTGDVTVKDTATFGGTGTVSGAVILESGGTLAPGASVGTLATGALTVPASAKLAAQIDSSGIPTADQVNVTGNLTLGGALTVTDIAGTPAAITLGTKLTLITYSGTLTDTFSGKPEESTFAVGDNTFKIRYADGGKNVTLEAVAAGTGYAGWAGTNAPSQTAGQDYDNDGVSNGVEWVLGGLAATNDLDKLPTVSTAGGDLTFSFDRDQDSKTVDTAVSIEVGTDLSIWTSYPVPDSGVLGPVTVTDNLDGTDTVSLTVTQTPDAKKFARLNVVVTP